MKTRGSSLIEVLAYMAGFTIIMTGSYQLLTKYRQSSQIVIGNSQDIISTMKAGETWRADIRFATETPYMRQQTLHIPQQHGIVQYKFIAQDNSFMRKQHQNDWVVVMKKVKSAEFSQETRKYTKVWHLNIELQAQKDARMKPLFCFVVPEK